MPLLSICIPAYNRAEHLPELLESILSQNYTNYEIVIAEDNSPQRTSISAVVSTYSRLHGNRIYYHENPFNLGYDANLRKLIELSSGLYVLFMGNDDLLAPGALASVAEALCSRNNVGAILRSYSSFYTNPADVAQVFRYFDEDRIFMPGQESIITFFRRSVFISGMVFKRTTALAYATNRFDGTLLYQQHLVGNILKHEYGVYLHRILSYHRLGGVPDFGVSQSEQGLFVPKQQTPESSVQFMRGMLTIAFSLDEDNHHKVGLRILRDIGNYAYPILSIQADRPYPTFLIYLWQLMQLGFWRVPLFHVYAIGLIVLGRKNLDFLIAQIKKKKGRTPLLGKVYIGETHNKRSY